MTEWINHCLTGNHTSTQIWSGNTVSKPGHMQYTWDAYQSISTNKKIRQAFTYSKRRYYYTLIFGFHSRKWVPDYERIQVFLFCAYCYVIVNEMNSNRSVTLWAIFAHFEWEDIIIDCKFLWCSPNNSACDDINMPADARWLNGPLSDGVLAPWNWYWLLVTYICP